MRAIEHKVYNELVKSERPLAFHCTGGTGRTGTGLLATIINYYWRHHNEDFLKRSANSERTGKV